ncbi:MAG: TatD family hydrolase, partial [Candidatus Aminicenantes bacterium]|nr:TatD family hydrolase [Candidatus Aminicenantes bacterium]
MQEIDFHCHLDSESFNGNRVEAVSECFDAGFSALVTVADPYEIDSESRTLEALEAHPRVFLMVAAHPHNADQYTPEVERRLERMLAHPRSIGLGEA